MSVTLAVVIVNFNAGEALTRCVQSLAPALEGVSWEAIVVDNASSDDSHRRAESEPGVRVLALDTNGGFASGANRGAAATGAQWLLFLNPDCELLGVPLIELFREFERDPRCALVGPGILEANGELQGSARGDPSILTGLFGRSSWLTARFPHLRIVQRNVLPPVVDDGQSSRVVDWVSGAGMLVRRSAFDKVRGFDEGFFLFWEDADLCRRLRAAGHTIRYAPEPRLRHSVGVSRGSAPARSIREFHRSAYRYYTKWSGTSEWSPARMFAAAVLSGRCAWALASASEPVRALRPFMGALQLPASVGAAILIALAVLVVLLPDGWWPARSVLSVVAVAVAAVALVAGEVPRSIRGAAPYLAYGLVMVASAWRVGFPPASTDVLAAHGCAVAIVFAVSRLASTAHLRSWTMLSGLVSLQLVLLGTFGPQFYPDVYGRSRFYAAVTQWGAYPELGLLALLFGAACAGAAFALSAIPARCAAWVLVAFGAVVPFYVESRGAQIALVATIVWLAIAALMRWHDRMAAAIVIAMGAATIAGIAYVTMTIDIGERLQRAGQATEWTSRYSYWRAAWGMAVENPLLGVGPGRYPLELRRFIDGTVVGHAHNMLLHVAAETGFPGLAAFAWLWVRILGRSFQAAGRDVSGATAFMTHAMLAAFVLRGVTDHFLAGVHSSFRTALLMGLIFGLAEASPRQGPAKSRTLRTKVGGRDFSPAEALSPEPFAMSLPLRVHFTCQRWHRPLGLSGRALQP